MPIKINMDNLLYTLLPYFIARLPFSNHNFGIKNKNRKSAFLAVIYNCYDDKNMSNGPFT